MDAIRFGLSVRALRRRRRWSQERLGQASDLSGSAISRIERGLASRYSVRALTRVADALGARLAVRLLWQGEELDRLLDSGHARLVEWTVRRLTNCRWMPLPEVTFQIGSERGSIDVMAWHPGKQQLLIVEVKSVIPDVQATLAGLDRKARLAPRIARDRGWDARSVSRVLVLPDDRTARRRLSVFAATFDRALPARTVAMRRWIDAPDGPIAGVMFVSDLPDVGARHRVRPRSIAPVRETPSGS